MNATKLFFKLSTAIIYCSIIIVSFLPFTAVAQFSMPGVNGGSPIPGAGLGLNRNNNRFNDTTGNSADSIFSKNKKWVNETAKIYYTYINSDVKHYPDTAILHFNRYQPTQPYWGVDLGNLYAPAENLFFTPFQASGMSLGYHIWDLYRYNINNLAFYNTTRPYTDFHFSLGSKAEQIAELLHTQNISPLWNFAVRIRNNNAPGTFFWQRTTGVSGSVSSNYKSKNQRYTTNIGFVYNRFTQDENGGITADSLLTSKLFPGRESLPVNYAPQFRSSRRSPVTNRLRDLDLVWQNKYSWGLRDTVYNQDSTKATFRFTPRFSLKHQLQLTSEKHTFNDNNPVPARYALAAPLAFVAGDTVRSVLRSIGFDNRFSINGTLGKGVKLLNAEAGVGIRLDNIKSKRVIDSASHTYMNNYVFAHINKEALAPGQWLYNAALQFYFTGPAAANFDIDISIGKEIKNIGTLIAGFRQTRSEVPFSYSRYPTNFWVDTFSFNKMGISKLWATLLLHKYNIELGINNYIMSNYLYYDNQYNIQQQSSAFSVIQVHARKLFSYKTFRSDNEAIWQQASNTAPIHLPQFMIRSSIGVETYLFKNALKIATGIEVKYNTPYYNDGYAPIYNQFYVQDSIKQKNPIALSLYFNFKVKRLRVFIMGDQLQQLFIKKNIINIIGYPEQNALFRFGFNWVMIN